MMSEKVGEVLRLFETNTLCDGALRRASIICSEV